MKKRRLFSKSGKELQEELEETWHRFEKSTEPIKGIGDVPFPPSDFAVDPTMTTADTRSYLSVILLRYHPDKFFSKFSGRLQCPGGNDDIRLKLNDIAMRAGELRRSFSQPSNPDSDI